MNYLNTQDLYLDRIVANPATGYICKVDRISITGPSFIKVIFRNIIEDLHSYLYLERIYLYSTTTDFLSLKEYLKFVTNKIKITTSNEISISRRAI